MFIASEDLKDLSPSVRSSRGQAKRNQTEWPVVMGNRKVHRELLCCCEAKTKCCETKAQPRSCDLLHDRGLEQLAAFILTVLAGLSLERLGPNIHLTRDEKTNPQGESLL
jgi:hypothetical protein